MSVFGWALIAFAVGANTVTLWCCTRNQIRANERINEIEDRLRSLASRYYELDNQLKFRKASGSNT